MFACWKTICIGLIALVISCSSSTKQFPSAFSCFEGKWQLENSNTFEIWQKHDSFLSGQVIKIKNADTLLVEQLQIFQDKSNIYYEATVASQNNGKPVRFQLTGQSKNEFQFENSNHDFPKQIIYTFQDTTLTAQISGGEKHVTFTYQKIK
jgi:hypothetical protein